MTERAGPAAASPVLDLLSEDVEELYSLVGGLTDAAPVVPASTPDTGAATQRGAHAVMHGLRRGAEDWHPKVRGDAAQLAAIRRAERRLEMAVRGWMRGLQQALAAMQDHLIVDPASLAYFDWDRWDAAFVAETRRAFAAALVVGGDAARAEFRGATRERGTARRWLRRRAAEDASIDLAWSVESAEAQLWIEEHGLELARGLTDTTRERLRGILRRSYAEGLSVDKIARRIRDAFTDMTTWRSRLIAQTETIRAYSEGALQVYREARVERKEWLDGQLRSCETCLALDGQVVNLDENFDGGYGAPPAHPGCRCSLAAVVERAKAASG